MAHRLIPNTPTKAVTFSLIFALVIAGLFGTMIYRANAAENAKKNVIVIAKIVCHENNIQNDVLIKTIRDGVLNNANLKIEGYGKNEKEYGRRNANELLKSLAPLDCAALPERRLRKPPPTPLTEAEAGSVGHTLPPPSG